MAPSKKNDATDPLARVQAARNEAARAMTELAGNTSACAMARDGRSFPAYKYYEGRAASLGSLSRRLRGTEEVEHGQVVHALVDEWRQEVESRAGHGRDWQAYTAGGLDAAVAAEEWIG